MDETPREATAENLFDLWDRAGNLYMAVAVISKRASQIEEELNEELALQLHVDLSMLATEDPVVRQQREAIAIKYEQMPKPVNLALEEFKRGFLRYEYRGSLARDSKAHSRVEEVG